MAAGVPCALVTSCSSTFTGDRLVQHILGTEDLLVEATANDAVRFYPWTIDNKYYSADINLCVVPNKFLVTAEIAESVQAFVVYFDSTQKSGLDSVSSWLPLAEAWLPEVMILVCDRVSENGVNRQKAQEWCIKHGFELVELSPEELPEEDGKVCTEWCHPHFAVIKHDFPESTGVKRIVQALNANVWSNVVMKNDRNQGFGLLSSLAGANHSIGSADPCHSEKWQRIFKIDKRRIYSSPLVPGTCERGWFSIRAVSLSRCLQSGWFHVFLLACFLKSARISLRHKVASRSLNIK
ncbi:alpha- and gamma-adaptin-binding protein p34 isoform X4 [Myotis daubentonii]|uniref:alpha- and gamma-adaptin-binding protein p34 isoform X4 n=1 Tax=Myotis daubentonii TaxID=98922 RepID=UPI002872F2FD|nr:alpha- and gamma-adaptin-binding protein p34 isoform X4 [Myotis daubentonii]